MMPKKPITVLIVDDSELIRRLLTEILSSDPDIEVIGSAVDPFDARTKIKELQPDVLTLDIEMPRMDGITFLENLMRLRPMPVIMISTLTEKGADATIRALELGAMDYIPKPKMHVREQLDILADTITSTIKQAASANLSALEHNVQQLQFSNTQVKTSASLSNDIALIAIGSSTGGTEAIKEILTSLPDNMPPIVIVQHMPGGFTTSFARRLDSMLNLTVSELTGSNTALEKNHVYIGNGNEHVIVHQTGNRLYASCEDSEPVNRHKPAVDKLFDSVAEVCAPKTVGVILTGMGSDGAAGLLNMRQQGSITVAQDEASSVVWGMPRAATELDAASKVLPLKKIARFLVHLTYSE